ncbi:hypothetical protein [Maridesulfovibrio sp.]|nr:hypothetical protein [Maridesulfovibrio sp.]
MSVLIRKEHDERSLLVAKGALSNLFTDLPEMTIATDNVDSSYIY